MEKREKQNTKKKTRILLAYCVSSAISLAKRYNKVFQPRALGNATASPNMTWPMPSLVPLPEGAPFTAPIDPPGSAR